MFSFLFNMAHIMKIDFHRIVQNEICFTILFNSLKIRIVQRQEQQEINCAQDSWMNTRDDERSRMDEAGWFVRESKDDDAVGCVVCARKQKQRHAKKRRREKNCNEICSHGNVNFISFSYLCYLLIDAQTQKPASQPLEPTNRRKKQKEIRNENKSHHTN